MGVHFCHPGSCDGAPYRLYVHTRRGTWLIGEKSQIYDRKAKRYTDRWGYVAFRPSAE